MDLYQTDESHATPLEEPDHAIETEEYTKSVQNFQIAGHLVQLPRGVFCLTVVNPNRSDRQPLQPSVRISPWPTQNATVEITGCRPDGWLNPGGDAALLRVHKSPGHILITVHQLPNEPPTDPKLNIRRMISTVEPSEVKIAKKSLTNPVRSAPNVLVHIQGRGDVAAKFGEWLGAPGCGRPIEGFCIWSPDSIQASDISYQAVIEKDWISPLVNAGEYCGTKGMEVPILGFNVQLSKKAQFEFDLTYSATFVDGTRVGPLKSGTICKSSSMSPLEAILINLRPL